MMRSVALRAVAEVALGRQRSPQHDSGPNMVPYLRAANVKDGVLDLEDVKSMNFTPAEQQSFSLMPGDVLVTEGSGSLTAVGASAVWQGELQAPVCFQNTLLRLRPRPEHANGRFLAWWARSAFASGLFASIASGANIYHISAERVRSLTLDLPPLAEQRRIADFLDAETQRIDQLAALREEQQMRLEELAAATVSEAVAPAPGTVNVRLGYLARIQSGITVDAAREIPADAVARPYLRVANVQAGWLELDSVTDIIVPRALAESSTLQAGDVLMTEGGDLDKLGRGTVWHDEIPGCLHQNHVFAVRPAPDRLDGDYLVLLTRSDYGRAYFESTGTKTTNLASTSSGKIRDFRIPLRPLPEQRAIVEQATSTLTRLDELAVQLKYQQVRLSENRQAMITAAVTGQFDVSSAYGVGTG